ncbi:MAG TPA: cell division protein ZapB, partial [Rhodanobacteraceae bacterium]
MRSNVLAATIAIVLGASSAVMAAPAATQTSESAEIQQLRQQIAALQAKVDELSQRSDEQSSVNASTQQSIQAMQQKQSQAPSSSWADSTRIGGVSYIDFTDIDQTKNGTKTDASGTGLDVKRFYLSVDHTFNDIWSADLTTDFNYSSSDGETQLFVKKA